MMLCGGNGTTQMTKEEKEKQKLIEDELRNTKKRINTEFKLLLLGGGESGKSTIAKQMKILHMNGFSEQERKAYRDIIHSNIILSIRALIFAAAKFENALSDANAERAEEFKSNAILGNQELTPERAIAIKSIWSDPAIQATYQRSSEIQINDSADYYLNKVSELAGDFLPSQDDVLRARAKTTGITEIEFGVQKTKFRLVDVGGQRSERKKWIHCFQDVTAVLFCTALSEYDQSLYEDETVNRMHESLKLFDEICNSRWFSKVAIILFLNKSDLFQKKITKVDLSCCFPKYTGGLSYDHGLNYIREEFLATNKNQGQKLIFPHVTCATNTENVRAVFEATRQIIIQRSMEESGF
eukprot:TRINITY_DN11583_c0_g1_i1.p1 TRINITY_DN11583_c0_g1~~TRINITY_DN11583_c0_g1_i1.p1  ORF type:complete len:355 (-),score=159.95 TRINITY_DN11583_c0_g1_i1:116-1180(-)